MSPWVRSINEIIAPAFERTLEANNAGLTVVCIFLTLFARV
ncbi:hypothetical protein [Mesomycoplasma ovipneumoniae]